MTLSIVFVQFGLNEADTLESSSILIYRYLEHSLYTQEEQQHVFMINARLKMKGEIK
jgi:hypothetical protein